MNRLVVPSLAGSTIRFMTMKRMAACAALATLGGCSAPPRPHAAPPDVPLASPSGWRSGIVEQSIKEASERRFIRDLWRTGEDAQ